MIEATTAIIRPALIPMTKEEAERCCVRITSHLEDARSALLELSERQGWKALGYASWRACVQDKFGGCQARVYQLLNAAVVERELAPITAQLIKPEPARSTTVEIPPAPPRAPSFLTKPPPPLPPPPAKPPQIPERVLRPLTRIAEPETRKEVWQEAIHQSNGEMPKSSTVEEILAKVRAGMPAETLAKLVESEERATLDRQRQSDQIAVELSEQEKFTRGVSRIRQATSVFRKLGERYAAIVPHLECAMAEAKKIHSGDEVEEEIVETPDDDCDE